MKTFRSCRILPAMLGIWSLAQMPLTAVNEKGEWPWNLKLNGWHDRAIAEDLGTGWFLNVGPTGLSRRRWAQ